MFSQFQGLTFCIHTFGCQMNKHDSERISGMLESLGAVPVETIEDADIVVFMTCCVREAADIRLYGQVASMKNIKLRDESPISKKNRGSWRLHRPARRREADRAASSS